MIQLDDIDHHLIRSLARDATPSAGALGRHLGLSQPATWRRIRRLEEAGVLRGKRLRLNREALGFGVLRQEVIAAVGCGRENDLVGAAGFLKAMKDVPKHGLSRQVQHDFSR